MSSLPKRIVVVDMDHTIIWCKPISQERVNLDPMAFSSSTTDHFKILVRPGCETFLQFLKTSEDILPVLYTAGEKEYTRNIMERVPLMNEVFSKYGITIARRGRPTPKTIERLERYVLHKYPGLEEIERNTIIFDDTKDAAWQVAHSPKYGFVRVKKFYPGRFRSYTFELPDMRPIKLPEYLLQGKSEDEWLFQKYINIITKSLDYTGTMNEFILQLKQAVFEQGMRSRVPAHRRFFEEKTLNFCCRGLLAEYKAHHHQHIFYGEGSSLQHEMKEFGLNVVRLHPVILTSVTNERDGPNSDPVKPIGKAFKKVAVHKCTNEQLVVSVEWLAACMYTFENLFVDDFILQNKTLLYEEDIQIFKKRKLDTKPKKFMISRNALNELNAAKLAVLEEASSLKEKNKNHLERVLALLLQ